MTDTPIRALTVRQPWAWAIIHGPPHGSPKDIENRMWRTPYRGPLLIHAAARPAYGIVVPYFRDLFVTSAIIGLVDLVDVTRTSTSVWYHRGHWAWHLRRPRPLPVPIPATGAQGLWRPSSAILEAVALLCDADDVDFSDLPDCLAAERLNACRP